jgi:hypothetical protein
MGQVSAGQDVVMSSWSGGDRASELDFRVSLTSNLLRGTNDPATPSPFNERSAFMLPPSRLF